MTDQHPAQADYQEWWPGGHDRWIQQAMSIEQLVRSAFLAGWDARNSHLRALALTPDSDPQGEYAPEPLMYPGPIPLPGQQSPGWRGFPQPAPDMPQRTPGQSLLPSGPAPGRNWMAEMAARAGGGPAPVMRLADYANSRDLARPQPPAGPDLATLGRIKQRIEAITPAPGRSAVPDPAETRDLPVIRADDNPLDITFERLQAAWTEEYGPEGHEEDTKWVS